VKLRVAAAAYPIEAHAHLDDWAAKLERWVTEAAAGGAALAVFPEYGSLELASLLPPAEQRDLAATLAGIQPWFADLQAAVVGAARRGGVHVLAPSFPLVMADGRTVNRALFVSPAGAIGWQDKLVMTRFERERWRVVAGDALRVFATDLGRIAVSICYDAEFPLLARAQAEAGAEVFLVPSCTDTLAGYHRVRTGARARALENQAFVIQAPTVGDAPWSEAIDVNTGAAAIYCPSDRGLPADGVVAGGALDHPGWVFADLDLAVLRDVRRDGQVLNLAHWPESAVGVERAVEVTRLSC
jgi:predicted amidohydrolase